MKLKDIIAIVPEEDHDHLAVFLQNCRIYRTDGDRHSSKMLWNKYEDYEVERIYPTIDHNGLTEITCILKNTKPDKETFSPFVISNIVEISKNVGCILRQNDCGIGCSGELRNEIIQWAKEFETVWNKDIGDYFSDIEEYTNNKLNQYLK